MFLGHKELAQQNIIRIFIQLAGGAKMEDPVSFFKVTYDVIRAGAFGVA